MPITLDFYINNGMTKVVMNNNDVNPPEFVRFDASHPADSKPTHEIAFNKIRQHIASKMKLESGISTVEMNFLLNATLRGAGCEQVVQWIDLEKPTTPRPNLNGKVVVTPAFNSGSEDGGRNDLQKYIRGIMTQNPLPKRIVVPIGLMDTGIANHYNAIVIEPGNPSRIYGFDPMGKSSSYTPKLSRVISDIKPLLPNGGQDAIVEFNGPSQKVQQNGYSCGMWSAWFIKSIAANPDHPIEKFHALADLVTEKLDTASKLNAFIHTQFNHGRELLLRSDLSRPAPAPSIMPTQPIILADVWVVTDRFPVQLSARQNQSITNPNHVSAVSSLHQVPSSTYQPSSGQFSPSVPKANHETVVYQNKSNPNNDYKVVVTATGVIGPYMDKSNKFPNNQDDYVGFRKSLEQTMKFAKENAGMTEFVVQSGTQPVPDERFLKKLEIILAVAAEQGIAVKLSKQDNRCLNQIYEERGSSVQKKLSDKAMELIDRVGGTGYVPPSPGRH